MEIYTELRMLRRILREIKILRREIVSLKLRMTALENENQERRLENYNLLRRDQNDHPIDRWDS